MLREDKPLARSRKDKFLNSQRPDRLPHVIAAVGSVIFLTCLPIFLYFVLLFAANDTGGPLNLIVIPCLNFVTAILFTLIFFFPLSKLLDWLFQKGSRTKQRSRNSFYVSAVLLGLVLVLVMGGFILAVGIILQNPLVLRILDTQVNSVMVWLLRVLFYGGLPVLLGGATYWFLLQTSRKVLSTRQAGQELSEYPKAG